MGVDLAGLDQVRRDMPSEMTSKARTARQYFLYGAGDGKRIVDTMKLAAAAGVHAETIRRHLPKWEAEYEQIIASTSKSGLGLKLSAEVLKAHSSDMEFLRDQINQVKYELENLAEFTAKLEGLTELLVAKADESPDRVLRVFEDWLRSCGERRTLRSQFLALQKQWTALGGVEDLKEVAVVREKELAKGRAKMDLEEEKAKGKERDTPRTVGGGVFGSGPALLDGTEAI